MTITAHQIAGIKIIQPAVFGDERGEFFRYFCTRESGEDLKFVQFNHSVNKLTGTFRGMHYQVPPACEYKLVRCVSGEVCDIFVDLREGSPTFLQWDHLMLSQENKTSVLLPPGVAHGFITLKDNSDLIYHHTEFYKPEFEKAINYQDPMIGITLPIAIEVISDRDKKHPNLEVNFKGIRV